MQRGLLLYVGQSWQTMPIQKSAAALECACIGERTSQPFEGVPSSSSKFELGLVSGGQQRVPFPLFKRHFQTPESHRSGLRALS